VLCLHVFDDDTRAGRRKSYVLDPYAPSLWPQKPVALNAREPVRPADLFSGPSYGSFVPALCEAAGKLWCSLPDGSVRCSAVGNARVWDPRDAQDILTSGFVWQWYVGKYATAGTVVSGHTLDAFPYEDLAEASGYVFERLAADGRWIAHTEDPSGSVGPNEFHVSNAAGFPRFDYGMLGADTDCHVRIRIHYGDALPAITGDYQPQKIVANHRSVAGVEVRNELSMLGPVIERGHQVRTLFPSDSLTVGTSSATLHAEALPWDERVPGIYEWDGLTMTTKRSSLVRVTVQNDDGEFQDLSQGALDRGGWTGAVCRLVNYQGVIGVEMFHCRVHTATTVGATLSGLTTTIPWDASIQALVAMNALTVRESRYGEATERSMASLSIDVTFTNSGGFLRINFGGAGAPWTSPAGSAPLSPTFLMLGFASTWQAPLLITAVGGYHVASVQAQGFWAGAPYSVAAATHNIAETVGGSSHSLVLEVDDTLAAASLVWRDSGTQDVLDAQSGTYRLRRRRLLVGIADATEEIGPDLVAKVIYFSAYGNPFDPLSESERFAKYNLIALEQNGADEADRFETQKREVLGEKVSGLVGSLDRLLVLYPSSAQLWRATPSAPDTLFMDFSEAGGTHPVTVGRAVFVHGPRGVRAVTLDGLGHDAMTESGPGEGVADIGHYTVRAACWWPALACYCLAVDLNSVSADAASWGLTTGEKILALRWLPEERSWRWAIWQSPSLHLFGSLVTMKAVRGTLWLGSDRWLSLGNTPRDQDNATTPEVWVDYPIKVRWPWMPLGEVGGMKLLRQCDIEQVGTSTARLYLRQGVHIPTVSVTRTGTTYGQPRNRLGLRCQAVSLELEAIPPWRLQAFQFEGARLPR